MPSRVGGNAPSAQGVRPMKARSRLCSSASDHDLDLRAVVAAVSQASSTSAGSDSMATTWRCTSSASSRSSSPVARARSHVWISTSGVQVSSTAASSDSRPGWPQSSTRPATPGSSSARWIASRTTAHARAGSSSTGGIGPASTPNVPSRKSGGGSHSTRWRTTSRATHPSQGAGLSHAGLRTAATRAREGLGHVGEPLGDLGQRCLPFLLRNHPAAERVRHGATADVGSRPR